MYITKILKMLDKLETGAIMPNKSSKKTSRTKYNGSIILWTGVLLIFILVLRPLAYSWVVEHNNTVNAKYIIPTDAPFKVSMSLVALITFFGFVWLGFRSGGALALHKGGMRLAIAAAVIVVDLVILTSMVFSSNYLDTTKTITNGVETSAVKTTEVVPTELATTLIKSFNAVVAVVIAFYFGTSAYVQVKDKATEDEDERDDSENPPRSEPTL